MTSPTPAASRPMPPNRPPPKRSWLKRASIVVAILIVSIAVGLAMMPYLLSTGWVTDRVASLLGSKLGTEVTIADHEFGWSDGLAVDAMTIANPEGFPADEKLLELRSLRGDFGLFALLRGRVDLSGTIDGLAVRVRQRADGTTNVGELFGIRPDTPPPRDEPDRPRELPDLSGWKLDLALTDAVIEVVHDEHGQLERLENVQARIHKDYGSAELQVEFSCDLDHPGAEGRKGRIELRLDAEPDPSRPVDMRLVCDGVDLARYRPILASFIADDQVTAFSGRLSADAHVTGVPDSQLDVRGEVVLDAPRFAGPAFGGMDLSADRWTVQPDIAIGLAGGAPLKLDLSGLRADVGFATLSGLPTAPGPDGAPAAGLSFDVDVARLAEAGGPLPELLRGSGTRVRGELRLPLSADLGELPPAKIVERIALDSVVSLGSLDLAGQSLSEVEADVDLADGQLSVATRKATFAGAPLTFRLTANAGELERLPAELSVGIDGARLGGGSVVALRYAVPLLAGLESATASKFESLGDLSLQLSGPLRRAGDESLLQWLDDYQGSGRLALRDTSFVLAPALAGLMQIAGGNELQLKSLSTDFELSDGFIDTGLMKVAAHGSEFGITGRTGLDGSLEYSIDLRSLLAAHADGAKVLEYLGDTTVAAKLSGSVEAPQLVMPDLQDILEDALGSTLEEKARERIEKEAGGLLERIFGGRRKDAEPDRPQPKPKSPSKSLEDRAREALEKLTPLPKSPPKTPPKPQPDGGR